METSAIRWPSILIMIAMSLCDLCMDLWTLIVHVRALCACVDMIPSDPKVTEGSRSVVCGVPPKKKKKAVDLHNTPFSVVSPRCMSVEAFHVPQSTDDRSGAGRSWWPIIHQLRFRADEKTTRQRERTMFSVLYRRWRLAWIIVVVAQCKNLKFSEILWSAGRPGRWGGGGMLASSEMFFFQKNRKCRGVTTDQQSYQVWVGVLPNRSLLLFPQFSLISSHSETCNWIRRFGPDTRTFFRLNIKKKKTATAFQILGKGTLTETLYIFEIKSIFPNSFSSPATQKLAIGYDKSILLLFHFPRQAGLRLSRLSSVELFFLCKVVGTKKKKTKKKKTFHRHSRWLYSQQQSSSSSSNRFIKHDVSTRKLGPSSGIRPSFLNRSILYFFVALSRCCYASPEIVLKKC